MTSACLSPGAQALGEASCHVMRKLKQPNRQLHMDRNWGLNDQNQRYLARHMSEQPWKWILQLQLGLQMTAIYE